MKRFIVWAALAVLGPSGTALAQDGGVAEPPPHVEDGAESGAIGDGGVQRRERARPSPSHDAPTERPLPEPREPAEPSALIEPDAGVEASDGGAATLLEDASSDDLDGGVADPGEPATPDLASGPADAGVEEVAADAGVAADTAAPEAAAPPASDDDSGPRRDLFSAFSNWLWEHAERRPIQQPTTTSESAPPPARESASESLREWLDVVLPARHVSSFGLAFFLALAVLGVWLVARARGSLPERGVIPRFLSGAHLLFKLIVAAMLFILLSRLLPSWLSPALLLASAAVAVALGFGVVWLLLPDVIGALVLLTERRLRRGQWVVGEGFAGTVEELGLRVTVLRAPDGSLVAVPNRRVIKSPMRTSDRPWHEIDVELRSPEGADAHQLREAIREAVLCSPYVPSNPGLVLSRDPLDPERWRMKVRLIDVRFSEAFEGEILERIEESLARSPDAVAR